MFYDTKIEMYLYPEEAPVKTIYSDVQPYKGTVVFNYGLSLEISKRIFCDVDKQINEEAYFKIDDVYYKVLNIKEWSDHLEVFLYKCKRMVG